MGTRGERGATGGLCSVEELPKVREQELRDAMGCLGGAEIEFLGYEDQKLAQAPADEMRRKLVALIRRWRPEVVLTFDPNGANLHTDHMAISRFTSEAVAAAADGRWYPELGSSFAVRRLLWQSEIKVWELGSTKNLDRQPGIDFLLDVTEWKGRKEAALRAHRTQAPGFGKLFFSGGNALGVEAFRMGSGERPSRVPVADLFEDLV